VTATPRLKRKAFSLRVPHTPGPSAERKLMARPYSAVAEVPPPRRVA
jgi:hypothetical protein